VPGKSLQANAPAADQFFEVVAPRKSGQFSVAILLHNARLRSAQAWGLKSSNTLINNRHWKTNGIYSPQVEANMMDLMGEAGAKLHAPLAAVGFDVRSCLGPR